MLFKTFLKNHNLAGLQSTYWLLKASPPSLSVFLTLWWIISECEPKRQYAVPPSYHSWQKNRNLIERDKFPLLLSQRGNKSWRHVRSSLFTRSSGERHRKWDGETDSKVKTLSGIHCDSSPSLWASRFLAPTVYITAVLLIVESSHFRRKWDLPCHEDWWSPLTSATEALACSKIATKPFCLCSLKASHILCLSAVDFEHALFESW